MKFTIDQIAKACGGEAHIIEGEEEREVSSVVLDSRLVTEGGVFIAQPGEKVDGHSFIGQVFEKGVALVITELSPQKVQEKFGISENLWKSYIVVDNALLALKRIGKAYRETLLIPVVGITGSVGKTSTKEFIAGVLSEKYKVLKTEGNYNNEIGVPLTLLKIRPEHEVAVIEMGISEFGEMTRLSEMAQPTVAVITNIGQCHLENLKTRDGILKAKTEIFTHLREGAAVCLFAGDDKLSTIKEVKGVKPFFFGVKGDADNLSVSISDIEDNGLLGSRAKLSCGGAEMVVNVPLPGYHMVINSAAAANVAMILGLSSDEIKSGIENMKPISGRNNIVSIADITLIDDCYNANPVSMKSSIDLLKLYKGQTVAILGDMFELGANERELHAQVGRYAASEGVNRVYCVGTLCKDMYEAARDVFESDKPLDSRTKKDIFSSTEQISYWATRDQLIDGIREDILSGARELIPRNAGILVKASHGMHFEEIVKLFKELLAD